MQPQFEINDYGPEQSKTILKHTIEGETFSSISAPTGRGAYLIAASNAPQIWKDNADVTVTGIASTVIQAAITAGYYNILLSPGTFTMSGKGVALQYGTVHIAVGGVSIRGSGKTTIIDNIDGNDEYTFETEGTGGTHIAGVNISDMSFLSSVNTAPSGPAGFIWLYYTDDSYVENIWMNGNSIARYGIFLHTSLRNKVNVISTTGLVTDDIALMAADYNEISNVTGTSGNNGLYVGLTTASSYNSFSNMRFKTYTVNGFILNNTSIGNTFTDCGIEASVQSGWNVGTACTKNTFIRPYAHLCGNKAADFRDSFLLTGAGKYNVLIAPNITNGYYHGIHIYTSDYTQVIGGNVLNNSQGDAHNRAGIWLESSTYCDIAEITIGDDQGGGVTQGQGTRESGTSTNNKIHDNTYFGNFTANAYTPAGTSSYYQNKNYIAPNEIRTVYGSLVPTGTCTATTVSGTFTESPLALKPGANTMTCTATGVINVVMPAGSTAVVTSGDSTVTDSPKTCAAGATTPVTVTTGAGADTFTITVHSNAFAWHNPEVQDILIKKIVINRSAAGGTATAEMNVGIADNGTVDDPGTEFFNNMLINNAAAIHDSYVAGGTSYGTQTIWVNCDDSAAATNGWIVGKIDTEIANALAGTYYIEYVGK